MTKQLINSEDVNFLATIKQIQAGYVQLRELISDSTFMNRLEAFKDNTGDNGFKDYLEPELFGYTEEDDNESVQEALDMKIALLDHIYDTSYCILINKKPSHITTHPNYLKEEK